LTIVATAPGKLILLGEYAVLQGCPSLVLAVNRYATVTVQPVADKFHRVTSPTLQLKELPFRVLSDGSVEFIPSLTRDQEQKLHLFRQVVKFIVQQTGKFSFPSHHFHLDTDSFYLSAGGEKLGLGSSAALTVALVQAVFYLLTGREATRTELFRLARQAHHLAQGKSGSGIDIAAAVYGGLLYYRLTGSPNSAALPEAEELPFPRKLLFTTIWSGFSTSTAGMVQRVLRWQEHHPQNARNLFEQMCQVARQGISAVREGEIAELLNSCRRYRELLEALGEQSGADIFSPVHREVARLVEKAGGVYKPSGAGGGDVGIALWDSPERMTRFQQKILHFSYKIVNLEFSGHGARIERVL